MKKDEMPGLNYVAKRLSDLDAVAQQLIKAYPEARLFAFFGEMGVGKTTFIQFLCKRLGVHETVSSPSFSIVNHYLTKDNKSVYHFDFYRINSLEEVYDLGYEHYFFSGSYCFIEWPDRLGSLLPDHCIRVDMKDDRGCRIFSF